MTEDFKNESFMEEERAKEGSNADIEKNKKLREKMLDERLLHSRPKGHRGCKAP